MAAQHVDYLNTLSVQRALHVIPPGRSGTKWAVCSDPINAHWSLSDYLADVTALYSAIQTHPRRPEDFRMLIYSGDVDGVNAVVFF